MSLGTRLREKRQEIGFTLASLSERSGVSKTYLWELEHGKAANPGASVLQRISGVLGVSIDYLAVGEEYAERGQEIKIPGELARMADHLGLPFNKVYALLQVAKALEKSSTQFQLKPVHWDWRLLYEGVKGWL